MAGARKPTSWRSRSPRDPDHHPYEVIGCVPSARGQFELEPSSSIARLGEYGSVRRLLHEQKPAMLIFADPAPESGELVKLTELCIKENVQFKLIPSSSRSSPRAAPGKHQRRAGRGREQAPA